jgi:hypothetical protein
MTWNERFQTLQVEARRTNTFAHNLTCQRIYFQLLAAVESKDPVVTKKLMERMGF